MLCKGILNSIDHGLGRGWNSTVILTHLQHCKNKGKCCLKLDYYLDKINKNTITIISKNTAIVSQA